MKKLIGVFLATAAFVVCAAQKSKLVHNDLFFDNLKGSVEKVTEIPFSVISNGNMGAADSCCVHILTYDKRGYTMLDVSMDASGKGMNGQVYAKRYSNGKPREIQSIADGRVVNKLLSTLTKDGNDSTAYVYDTAGKLVFFYTDVEVNRYGKIISMKSYKPDRTRLQTIVNIYKEQTWVGGSVRDSSGREIFSTLIKLNEKHDPSELVQTQAVNGKPLISRIQYVYDQFDKHGNWIRRQELNEESGACKVVIREIRYRKI